MARLARPLCLLLLSALATSSARAQEELRTPEEFLGHPVGADRKLASYDRVLEYLRSVADHSDRVVIENLARSTLDNEIVTVVLSSPSNLENRDRYRDIARQLANGDQLDQATADQLIEEGKAIVLVTCTIHSNEVGATQMAMEFVHEFATTDDPEKLAWMEEVILLLMPSINPDGQFLIIDWYNEHLGTEYEGGPMPWLYHHYIGHDNNRDFYMLTQAETRAVNELLYHRWFPQVFIDEHQMGRTGPRMFVPPQTDPLAPEIHPLIFRQADLIGTNMSYRLEEAGKTGVGHNMIFDSYWPGGTRNTAWWKNVTGLLTEVASVAIATPIYIEPGELRGGGKGFPEYKRRANFPSPWPGGWWRLRDIVEYELIATWAALETSAEYRKELLENFYRMSREAAEGIHLDGPSAWVVSPDQHDPVAAGKLVELLLRHGVRVFRLDEPLTLGTTTYPAGSQVIPANQPYRAFLLTMLRPQRYPEVVPHVGGPIIQPYDVTSWSLPISMGVSLDEIETPFDAIWTPLQEPTWPSVVVTESEQGHWLSHAADSVFLAMNRLLEAETELYWIPHAEDQPPGEVYLPAGAVDTATLQQLADQLHLQPEVAFAAPTGEALRVRAPKVGLYKPWVASMDEGWTRFLLDENEFRYENLSNQDLQQGNFRRDTTVLLFPDVSKEILELGQPADRQAQRFWAKRPPEYSGGIGPEGAGQIRRWVEAGGTVIALDSSTEYFIDLFELPVVNVLAGVEQDAFSAPGTMFRLLVDNEHPVAYGMRPEEAGYFASSPAFQTSLPSAAIDRRVVARYPDHRSDVLVSGFVHGEDLLARKAAVVDFKVGEGHVLLIGFRAQHRAQPHRSFKLLFNALFRSALEKVELAPR